jgi:hypothetical protein
MNPNSLSRRRQMSRHMADNAAGPTPRSVFRQLARAYGSPIAAAEPRSTGEQTRGEVADELREEAASYRRLALRARTNRGSTALKTAADQFDQDARRIDPSSLKR